MLPYGAGAERARSAVYDAAIALRGMCPKGRLDECTEECGQGGHRHIPPNGRTLTRSPSPQGGMVICASEDNCPGDPEATLRSYRNTGTSADAAPGHAQRHSAVTGNRRGNLAPVRRTRMRRRRVSLERTGAPYPSESEAQVPGGGRSGPPSLRPSFPHTICGVLTTLCFQTQEHRSTSRTGADLPPPVSSSGIW